MDFIRRRFAEGAILLGFVGTCQGTPSGLNNIPTADTTPQGLFVLQAFSTIAGEMEEDFNVGFKTGIDLGPLAFEFGADSRILPGKAGPVTAQAKLALPLGDDLPMIALGSANTTFSSADANRAGDTFGYLVLSQDLHFLRAHAGCGLQDGSLLPFLGFDKTFTKENFHMGGNDGDLFTLRADMIQQQDSSWLYSAGFLVPISERVVIETWGNFPGNGDRASLTLKLNLVFPF